jgi:hypothetical protein
VLVHEDPSLPVIETPNGRVKFLQLVPVDAETLARAKGGNAEVTLAELARRDPELVLRLAAP